MTGRNPNHVFQQAGNAALHERPQWVGCGWSAWGREQPPALRPLHSFRPPAGLEIELKLREMSAAPIARIIAMMSLRSVGAAFGLLITSAVLGQSPEHTPHPAEAELSRRIAALERSGTTTDQSYIRALVDLASVYFSQGRHALARSPLERAAAASERLHGPGHVQTREIQTTLLLLDGYIRNQQASRTPRLPAAPAVGGAGSPTPNTTPARLISGSITSEDWPNAALREEAQGTVEVELRIGRSGRVRSCRLVRSSGNGALDNRTCSIIRERFEFAPATRNGRPIESRYRTSVRWVLPE